MENNKNLDNQEISLKRGDNLKELLKKINAAVNEAKNKLPINIVSEALNKKTNILNVKNALSFIFLGDNIVGKNYFLKEYFHPNVLFPNTIGINKEIKFVKIGKDYYKITLWDTAGQDRFKSLPKKYYQNADGILILFDVTNEATFNNAIKWIKEAKDSININNEGGQESEKPIYLIGNKIDLPCREISKEQAQAQANLFGIKYFEVCCKINMNIPEVMARMIMDCHMKSNPKDNCFMLSSKSSEGEDKKGCYGGKKEKKNK